MQNKFVIGARLRELREELGLRQDELASRLGKSRNTISAWERGDQYPSGEFFAMSADLGIDVQYLLTGVRATLSKDDLTPEEAALLDNYRASTGRGRKLARAMLNAITEWQDKRGAGGE